MPRVILNDAQDLQNVVDCQNLKNETKRTLKQLVKQLLQVSGPYSRNVFILYDNKTLNDGFNTDISGSSSMEIFTRDGIHTLSQIQYISPIQSYIKNQILTFMGRRIDACCSDGTTSSMLFTASFISYLLDDSDKFEACSLLEVENAYRAVTAKLLTQLNKSKLTKEKIEEETKLDRLQSVRLIAFLQALTSSGDNSDIANAIADIFYNTPEYAWKYAIRQKYPYKETPEFKVVAKQEDSQASYDCTIMTPELCNEDLGKYYQCDNVNILIMRNGMIRGSQCVTAILNYILKLRKKEDDPSETPIVPLVILLPTNAKAHDFSVMSEIQAGAMQVGLELFIAAYERPSGTQLDGLYSVDALSAKANINAFTENNVTDQAYLSLDPFLIKNASFRCDYHLCHIDNVIPYYTEKDLDNTDQMHPAERHPEKYEYYHIWKKLFLEALENDVAAGDKGSEPARKDLYKALMIMTCKKCWYIEIGGKSHDQQAIAHVLDDAAGAALAAVQHGVYLNGPNKLYAQTKKMLDTRGEYSNVERSILNAIKLAARDLIYAIFGKNAMSTTIPLNTVINKTTNPYHYINFKRSRDFYKTVETIPFAYLNNNPEVWYEWLDSNKITSIDLKELISNQTIDCLSSSTTIDSNPCSLFENLPSQVTKIESPPCQVGNLFEVLFERIREVALRFVFTDSLIAPGTVWNEHTDQESKQK